MIGQRIKERREELGLSQEELSHMLGYRNRSSINKIELGLQQLRLVKINEIANALQTTPMWLLGEDEEGERNIDFKELLRSRRRELNLTLLDIAKAVGVSESTVSRWESGDIADLKSSRVASLANVLQISPAAIITDDYTGINEKDDDITADVDDAYELGGKIKRLREARGLRLLDVAEACGVKEATAQRWESGSIKTIKPKHILAIARLFDCDPGYLLEKNENVIPKKNENSLYQYTNGFSGSVSKGRKEIMLRFFQNSPQYSPDGEFDGVIQEDVARIVMNDGSAMLLFNYLKSVLEPLL